ncbi:GIY-YIG nuclease family protein [Thalassospira sp.]|uniref:GIY-YIG nuclease family protein n=1 Tax=Thalassospira sp. TaxID=1912094 RepID=UPI00311EDB3F
MSSQKLFLTKTWGWFPERDPTFGFSQESARRKFLKEYSPGDWIVITGTKSAPTDPSEQGRLLGMCRVSREKVNAAKILEELGRELFDHELDENGQFKWPWAMPVIEARVFEPQPDTNEICGTYFPGQEWAAYALDLSNRVSPRVIQKILELPYRDADVAKIPEIRSAHAYEEANRLHREYGSSGPPPSPHRASSKRDLDVGYAYAFLLTGGRVKPAIKIGSTHDPVDRLNQLNKELRTELTGCRWEPITTQIFPHENFAYQFEQHLLKRLRAKLVPGQREVVKISVEQLLDAWASLYRSKDWVNPLGYANSLAE